MATRSLKACLASAAFLLAAFVARPQIACAAADPVTVETKWIVKTFSASTTSVTSATFDIGGFGSAGYAVLGNKYTQNGVDGTTLGNVVTVDTNTVNVIGFSYTAYSAGANATLQVAQTVKTPPPHAPFMWGVNSSTSIPNFTSQFPGANAFTVPVISTSAAILIPSSVPFSDVFQAQTENPIFIFSNLSTAATLYFTVDYGVPRPQ